jgi:type IV secretion system protein VirB9
MRRVFAVLLTGLIGLAPVLGFAEKEPRPITTDSRIKQVMYSANEVYEIVATYGFQTVVEFAETEEIKLVAIGDSIAWQAVPMGSKLFLKPVEPNTVTNMTVNTNKRIYFFNLLGSRNKSREALTYTVRFLYNDVIVSEPPAEAVKPTLASPAQAPQQSPALSLKAISDFNFNYAISGSKEIALVRAFDDGQFTYLQFSRMEDLPAVFVADGAGKESLVNMRIEGQYVVVERLATLFTLRNGTSVACLYNKARPFADASVSKAPRSLNTN